jgi:hypothetical protein
MNFFSLLSLARIITTTMRGVCAARSDKRNSSTSWSGALLLIYILQRAFVGRGTSPWLKYIYKRIAHLLNFNSVGAACSAATHRRWRDSNYFAFNRSHANPSSKCNWGYICTDNPMKLNLKLEKTQRTCATILFSCWNCIYCFYVLQNQVVKKLKHLWSMRGCGFLKKIQLPENKAINCWSRPLCLRMRKAST